MRITAFAVLLLAPALAAADGGALSFVKTVGNYRITVFTAPTPLRAGRADISVLVQNATTEQAAPDVRVAVTLNGGPAHLATKEAATNKLFYAAAIELPTPGSYTAEVSIDGPLGEARVRFELEAGEALPAWRTMWPWFAWPFGVILLVAVHRVLVHQARER